MAFRTYHLGSQLNSLAVRLMLFAFGDEKNAYTETIKVLQDLVHHFVADIVSKV